MAKKNELSFAESAGYHKEDDGAISPSIPEKYRGTAEDRHDMQVLGKTQVLRRNFKGITIMGFSSMVMVAWEALLVIVIYPLIDGGSPCLFWGLLIAPVGLTPVYMSLAELASMPLALTGVPRLEASQYHWVSELAPPKYQKPLSYGAKVVQGLISLNNPDYVAKSWHTTLLVVAINLVSVIFNTILAVRLPLIEGILLVLHLAGIFAIVIPLWVMGPRGNPREVLLEFTSIGGWESTGLATMIGLPAMIAMLYGYDCVVHMAEEVQDASRIIPPTILVGMWGNAVLMLIVGITFIFTMGDVEAILSTPTGVPFIQVFWNATGSIAATNLMTVIIVVMLISACFSEVATASRQIWSFARDKGLPQSRWLAVITPRWNIPLNAVCVSTVFTTLLALIDLGSSEALNAINSLAQVAILSSYMITILCLIWRRLRGPPLPARRWSLGKWGLTVNIVAVVFMVPIFIFATWPLEQPVTAVNM
ncbi:hypothetical protein DV738_g5440, partial [Chaetothyriales sp. CBS 135597]